MEKKNWFHHTIQFIIQSPSRKLTIVGKKCTQRENNIFSNTYKIPKLKINSIGIKAKEINFHPESKPTN